MVRPDRHGLPNPMLWFWIGFFAVVALLLALDLGVLHRKAETPTLKSATYWTVAWFTLGLSITGFVYLMYDNQWLGAHLHPNDMVSVKPGASQGPTAAMAYVGAFLLEYALSVDNIFVISLLFTSFRIPTKYQHRILFWGIIGAIGFRLAMLAAGAWLAHQFSWIFYVFGAYLALQGFKLMKPEHEEEEAAHDKKLVIRFLRRFVKIVDGDHGGRFMVHIDGRRAVTTAFVCLISIELTDIVFALDSIPAVLSVSSTVFIMVTSNIFAIMGLRSLYFVLAGAMDQFKYLKVALAVLLIIIGAKMVLHNHVHLPIWVSLSLIVGIVGTGVVASILSRKKEEAAASLKLAAQTGGEEGAAGPAGGQAAPLPEATVVAGSRPSADE